MKYIGTVITDTYPIHDHRTETLVRIDGLDRPQTIALFWSHERSPQALADLTAGTRIIFAARDETLAQRMETDQGTGMTATILVAQAKFYDVLADDVDVDRTYASIEEQDIELTGVVTSVIKGRSKNGRPKTTSVTLTAPRHGRQLPFQTRWRGAIGVTVENVRVGDEVTATIAERSLTWCVHVADDGIRGILPAGDATGLSQWTRPTAGSD